MKHDENHHSLITLSRTKELMMVQIWLLPQLELRHEIYCDTDITSYVRLVSTTTPCPSHPHTHTFILSQLELRHEIYCDTDITSYVRIISTTDASPLNTHKNYKYYL